LVKNLIFKFLTEEIISLGKNQHLANLKVYLPTGGGYWMMTSCHPRTVSEVGEYPHNSSWTFLTPSCEPQLRPPPGSSCHRRIRVENREEGRSSSVFCPAKILLE